MSRPEHDRDVARAFGELAQGAVAQAEGAREAGAAAERARLLARVRQAPEPRRLGFLLTAPLVAAVAFFVWWRWPAPLSYEVQGATTFGPYVSATAGHSAQVHFSDDTRIEVRPSSQLRVEDTTHDGARVFLERGQAEVSVVHRAESHWTFVAGPFDVLVTGTRFALQWDPVTEAFELDLHQGSVEVRSPLNATPVVLRAGQTFHADLAKRTTSTSELGGPKSASAAPLAPAASPRPAASAAASEEARASDAPTSEGQPALVTASSWPRLVARGQFQELLDQARARGTSNCLQHCSAADLGALADAARYRGQSALAEQSLRAVRDRFASAPEARSAAFLLGRLSEQRGDAGTARKWYVRYLSESPSGSYAAEALGGKMSTTAKLDGKAAAAPLAREYLNRYPKGVQAELARGILGSL